MDEQEVSSVFADIAEEGPRVEYATTGQRFANYLIDVVVYYAFNYLICFIMGICMALSGMTAEDISDLFSNKLVAVLVAVVNLVIVYTLIEGASKGRSLGKMITQTVAVKDDFSRITWKDAFMRTLCRLIPFEPFSAFGGNPWHDQFSHTHVIKKSRFNAE